MNPDHRTTVVAAAAMVTTVSQELQAIEMFAWALLRFPEAPEALKLGLLRTLEEDGSSGFVADHGVWLAMS